MTAMLRIVRSSSLAKTRAICQQRALSIGQVKCTSLVNVERQGRVATIELNRKPVNSFSLEFLEEINTNLEMLENDKECHGLIITSGLSKVFSAGLDLVKEVYKPDVKQLGLFWRRFQEMWLRLYGSRLVTIAAINGHALAGGCVVGLACDYRVIGDGLTIGLVELEAGIPLPFWVYSNLVNVVGRRAAEKAVLTSRRYGSEDALVIGMVDQVVRKDHVLSEAKKEMEKLLIHPAKPREITKRIMRKQFVERLENSREEDIEEFVDCILDKDVQKSIGLQIERLKQRSQ